MIQSVNILAMEGVGGQGVFFEFKTPHSDICFCHETVLLPLWMAIYLTRMVAGYLGSVYCNALADNYPTIRKKSAQAISCAVVIDITPNLPAIDALVMQLELHNKEVFDAVCEASGNFCIVCIQAPFEEHQVNREDESNPRSATPSKTSTTRSS